MGRLEHVEERLDRGMRVSDFWVVIMRSGLGEERRRIVAGLGIAFAELPGSAMC